MRRAEVVSGVVVSVVGVGALIPALGMGFFGPDGGLGPGFFPIALSAALVVLGGVLAVQGTRPQQVQVRAVGGAVSQVEKEAKAAVAEEDGPPPRGLRRIPKPALVWLSFAAAAAVMPVFGFVVTSVVLLLVLFFGVERRRGVLPLVAAIAVPIALYELFVDLLAIQLPVSLLDLGVLGI
ncbi:tripartite tricarboxylate transporter TctB family protein [Amycolatopsis sp. NPDC051903]|uniref:tripartite tricarboxylate transporter TctB family protein n=1 Tax=Amycolatopsis sp. NPDC051903 TaxID=3363936 RepID=UPI0037B004D6